MPSGTFYVYALLDPRENPPQTFYVGKGNGPRAYAHLAEDGENRKVRRIRDIAAAGKEPIIRLLATELAELDALRIEAQLIAAHGTVETGGPLLNAVVPSGEVTPRRADVVVPDGVPERAQLGLEMLKDAVLQLAAANPAGVSNADVVLELGLQSDHDGKHRNYLSWSILGILMREGRIEKVLGGSAAASRYKYVQVGRTGAA